MNRWMIRAVLWIRNPPSEKRVILVLVVIAACLAIWGAERLFGFPDWLVPQSVHPPRRLPEN